MSNKLDEQMKEIEKNAMEDLGLFRNEQGIILHKDSEQKEVNKNE